MADVELQEVIGTTQGVTIPTVRTPYDRLYVLAVILVITLVSRLTLGVLKLVLKSNGAVLETK